MKFKVPAASLPFIVTLIFATLNLIGILHHELWLDEMHHWLLARNSRSLSELFYNSRYDVHPVIWDSLLFFISRFTSDPFWMQVLNLIISSATAYLILKYAPFSLMIKVLMIFGYFTFYEYADISRNYSLGVLLLVVACILYPKRQQYYLWIVIVLGLLANIHLFCLFVSIACFIALMTDLIRSGKSRKLLLIGCSIYFVSALLSVWQITRHIELFVAFDPGTFLSVHRFIVSFSILTKGFFPLPDFSKINWWNSNWLYDISHFLSLILAITAFLVPAVIFRKNRTSIIIFYVSCFLTLFFIYLFQMSAVRYYGFVFMSFIAAWWVTKNTANVLKSEEGNGPLQAGITRALKYFVLAIQVISGLAAFVFDFRQPFSQGKNASDYLKASGLSQDIVAIGKSNTGPPIAGYLDKKVFYGDINQYGTYCNWNLPFENIPVDSAIKNIEHKCEVSDSNVIMLLDEPIRSQFTYDSSIKVDFINSFTGSIVLGENYFIYRVSLLRK